MSILSKNGLHIIIVTGRRKEHDQQIENSKSLHVFLYFMSATEMPGGSILYKIFKYKYLDINQVKMNQKMEVRFSNFYYQKLLRLIMRYQML